MKKILFVLSMAGIVFTACNNEKTDVEGDGRLVVRLTDAPADYEEVLIDLQELWVNVADDSTGWTELPLEVNGQIDLLELANGGDTLLFNDNFPSEKISQMRMILGENNEIKVGGEYYDLKTPSAQQSGLKFQVNATIDPGVDYEMWIDFDAARSIVETGNGKYILKPVIKVFTEVSSGSIKGVVSPVDARPLIQAISAANDTTSTLADTITGEFLIRGLEAGAYKVDFVPVSSYLEEELLDVDVTVGMVTDVDTVFFTGSN
ncbi:DUF4382 domain-containing protein [Prolixibacteraceae bacterium Z1-6]|uniref:DUF4382 domain-containing protein n=1 Tax=Draconibacterium aestuarii TaxID=2998507 RepID=A0A9X3J898_9BACT|nr:DUF4382 domain-containing protein [Prolixibacteraceae bacterium Z1-6]